MFRAKPPTLSMPRIARGWVVRSASEDSGDDTYFNDEEEGEDLCNCQFSLADNAKILVNTPLHFKDEHRYGLYGKNGTGKLRSGISFQRHASHHHT
jgi:elongation factor 3